MVIGMLLETLSVGLVIPTITLLTQPELLIDYPKVQTFISILGSPSDVELIVIGMLILVTIYLLKAIFLAYFAWKQNQFAYSVLAKLSENLYLGYLKQPWSFHIKNNSAYLLRNITTEANLLVGSVLLPILKFFTEILVLLGITVLLFLVEPVGAFLVISLLGVTGIAFQKLTQRKIIKWGEERQVHEGLRILQLQQGLKAVKEIKLMGRELNFLDLFSFHNLKSARAIQFKTTLQQLPRLWLESLAIVGLTCLVFLLIAQGKSINDILPIVGLFAVSTFRILPSVNKIIEAVQNFQYGKPAAKEVSAQISIIKNGTIVNHKEKMTLDKEILLGNLKFKYQDTNVVVIDDISLSIPKGSSTGVIGGSGEGKSTLIDLILGLISPTGGAILVDGINVSNNLRAWQNQIGYVPQHISLLDDSLLNNVVLGLPEDQIDLSAAKRAITAAQLDTFVKTLPQGFQTHIGENGVKLSGGQRQRIGIARALYSDPEILVFDEATSALDSTTEQQVMNAIKELRKNKTIIIVAHRLSTVFDCDNVYQIKNGKLMLVENLSQ